MNLYVVAPLNEAFNSELLSGIWFFTRGFELNEERPTARHQKDPIGPAVHTPLYTHDAKLVLSVMSGLTLDLCFWASHYQRDILLRMPMAWFA